MTNILKFKKLHDKIIHVTLPDHKTLAQALIRFQEHYESPFSEIKGKVFTVGFVKSLGNRSTGLNTYTGGTHFAQDWGGYNFPSSTVEPFIKGLFDPLTPVEADIVTALKFKQGPYYVIGTVEGVDPRMALDHEISHALYFISPEYKKEIDEVLRDYDLDGLRAWLKDDGYCDEVFMDEAQAYLGPDYKWLMGHTEDVRKYKVNIPEICHERIMVIRTKYVTSLGLTKETA